MAYVLGLVLLLAVLAGVIAFMGDRLGTVVGRRRLSLFGARPRLTGQIVGVVVGIVIMLTTLGVLALAFQNAAQTLVNAQRTADELQQLRAQEKVQQDRVSALSAQLDDLKTELAKAQQTIGNAQAQRDVALKERDQARQERDNLIAQRNQLQDQVDQLNKRVDAVNAELKQAQAQLTGTQSDLQAAQLAQTQALKARDKAQADATQARKDAAQLQQEVQSAKDQLEQSNARLTTLQGKLSDTEAHLASVEGKLQTAQASLDQAQKAQSDAEAARDQALKARDAAQQQATALKTQTEDLSAQIDQLKGEVADLQQQQSKLQVQATDLQHRNEGLQARNQTLSQQNARFVQQNQLLSAQKDELQQQIGVQNQKVQAMQAQLQDLTGRLETQARKLTQVTDEYNRATSGDVTFQKDELIYAGAIYAQDPAAIKDELTKFIADATTYVARRGVEKLRVTPEQFNSLVDVIAQTPGSDLVRLISPRNQFSSTVDVSVEAIENTKLYDKGQLVVSRQIHLGSAALPASQDEIRNALTQLKGDAVRKLRRAGLDEMQVPNFGSVTDDVFTSLLLRLHGPVNVGLVATDDIYRAGPAKLEMMVLY